MLARRARGRSGGDESEGLRVEVRGEFSRGGRFFISVSAWPPSTAVGDGWSGPLEMVMRTDGWSIPLERLSRLHRDILFSPFPA